VRFALALTIAVAGSGQAVRAAEFQVPPAPHHFVTDNAGALTDATRLALEQKLRDYSAKTGHQVIVWIGETTAGVPLETFTAESAHTWRIGRRAYDDGVVLFLFMADHRVRIEVGYGLEGNLTDADAKSIIDATIVPAMRAGDPDRAVTGGVNAILTTLSTGEHPAARPAARFQSALATAGVLLPLILIFGFSLLFVLVVIFARKTSARGGGAAGSDETLGSSSRDDNSSSSDDDFDAGGGDFGGGGASGSW
jgi:uncharacterized protein